MMNGKQQLALARAFIGLEKEFDHAVVIVCDKEKPGTDLQDDPQVCWTNGRVMAIHITDIAIAKMKRQKFTRNPPNVDKEISNAVMGKTKS